LAAQAFQSVQKKYYPGQELGNRQQLPALVFYPHILPGWTGSVIGTCWAIN